MLFGPFQYDLKVCRAIDDILSENETSRGKCKGCSCSFGRRLRQKVALFTGKRLKKAGMMVTLGTSADAYPDSWKVPPAQCGCN